LYYNELPIYDGNDLGIIYTKQETRFKIWAPQASAVKLRLYQAENEGQATKTFLRHDLNGQYWVLAANKKMINERGIQKVLGRSLQVTGTSAYVLFQQ